MNGERGKEGKYLVFTTRGAFFCITGILKGDQEKVMRWLFSHPVSPRLDVDLLDELKNEHGVDRPKHTLQAMLNRKLIQLGKEPDQCPQEPMQQVLPRILSELSDSSKAMITDSHGLCIASVGISEDRHEALSALASKITGALYHADSNVFDLLDMEYGLICLYDVGSRSLYTFIPLAFDPNRLVAVTQGKAVLSGQAFRDLIWILWDRYVLSRKPDDA